MKTYLKFNSKETSIMTAFAELQSIFGDDLTKKFYAVTLREYGISLQGEARQSTIETLRGIGFDLKLGERYLKASVGFVDVTLTFIIDDEL